MSTLALYQINWGYNPFFELLAWFNKSNIANNIGTLTMTLSVNGPFRLRRKNLMLAKN